MPEDIFKTKKCPVCEKQGMHVEHSPSYGYCLSCDSCDSEMTGNYWLDSSGPYEEAESLSS